MQAIQMSLLLRELAEKVIHLQNPNQKLSSLPLPEDDPTATSA